MVLSLLRELGREGEAGRGWGPLESVGGHLYVSWAFLFIWRVVPPER